jgi:DNA-binding MarR family transcriptional regulator
MDPNAALDLTISLTRLSAAVNRQIERPLAAYHGLSLADLALLLELQRAGGRMHRGDLAEHLGVTASGVARQLQPLERIRVVTRESHPTDARLAIVVLTKAGAQLATDAARTAAEAAGRAFDDRWSRPKQDRLAELVASGR